MKIAVQQVPNPEVMFMLALLCDQLSDHEQAKAMYESVLQKVPNHFEARVNLAIVNEKQGKSKIANKNYQDALKLKPKEAKLHHLMAINMKRAGNLQDALKCYKNAMDLEPDNSVFLYNTGLLLNIQS